MTNPVPGSRTRASNAQSIDEGSFANINGVDQWLTVRGSDRANPILFIIGGPGAAFSLMAPFFAPWQEHFTLVQWDQPGAGATFAKAGAANGVLTFDRLTSDAIAVIQFVLNRLLAKQLVVLGISGGSIIGLKLAKRRPDLVSASIGSGQIVNWPRQLALAYALALEAARMAGDEVAITELESVGPPPFKDMAGELILSKYATVQTAAEQRVFAALDPAVVEALRTPPQGASYLAKGLVLPDARARATAAYDEMRSEYAAFDARSLGLDFEVPMLFFQGSDDRYHVTSEVVSYAADVRAPVKQLALIEGAGASASLMREEMLALLKTHVWPRVSVRP